MDNELRTLRVKNNLPAKEMVAVVRELYPRFDKPLLSKCEHGDDYGVDLREDAMEALRAHVGDHAVPEAKKPAHKENRRKPVRCYCRMEESSHAALQRAIKAKGYATVQSWFDDVAKKCISGEQKPATGGTGQWIRIEDRPPKTGNVLMTVERKNGDKYVTPAKVTNGRWNIYPYNGDRITAWMPFPDPYTEPVP